MTTTHPNNPNPLIKHIAFFGDAQTPPHHLDYQQAFATAKLLAANGYTIINGGGPGIMDASTQGAKSVGGQAIAVTFSPKHAGSFEGRYLQNLSRVDKEIVASNYIERMLGLIKSSDAFIIFRGGSGTLSEFGTVWVLANIYFGHHKPFLLFGSFWWEIIDVLHHHMNIDNQEMSCFKIVETDQQALTALQQFEWQFSQTDHSHRNTSAEADFML